MTEHFNALTEAQQERLAILIEECGEVIQAACKILRHGYDSYDKWLLRETNRQQLEREIGDMLHALDRLQTQGDVNGININAHFASNPEHIEKYLHHQKLLVAVAEQPPFDDDEESYDEVCRDHGN